MRRLVSPRTISFSSWCAWWREEQRRTPGDSAREIASWPEPRTDKTEAWDSGEGETRFKSQPRTGRATRAGVGQNKTEARTPDLRRDVEMHGTRREMHEKDK